MMDYDTWKATEPEALVDVTPCEICGAVGEQPCCQDWIDCPRCGHEIERADNSPCDVHGGRGGMTMPRPYRPNPVPRRCPEGVRPDTHAKERRAAHPKQETASERRARKRAEANGRAGR